mgnify:CR=1 FL=1
MKFTVLIPVFNEEVTIKKVILEILSKYPEIDLTVINDGSFDDTGREINSIINNNFKILSYSENQGKGYALKYGLENVSEDGVVIFWDGDDELNSDNIQDLINFYTQNENCDILFGSRFLEPNKIQKYGLFKVVINSTLTQLGNLFMKSNLTDMETAVKSFKTKFIKTLNLKSNGFEIEPEITYQLSKLSNIFEIPIDYKPRTKKEGKKISFMDGFKTIITIIKLIIKN